MFSKPTFCFILSLLLVFLTVTSANNAVKIHFEKFKANFKKFYENANDEEQRFATFLKNFALINEHNEKYQKGQSSYRLDITEFADIEIEEFHEQMFGTIEDDDDVEEISAKFNFKPPKDIINIPTSMDWREKGAVTPVKGQKKCGSCWAFAATGALEAQNFLKTGQLISLSEQNLIDCTDMGCQGGNKQRAFQYVIDNDGIATEASYPYQAEKNPFCLFNQTVLGGTAMDYIVIPPNDEETMTLAVALAGPLTVSLNGKCLQHLQFYSDGIYNQPDCDPMRRNHGLLIVGYGQDNETKQDYWILKNSWGPKWGENGYIKVPRFQNYAGISFRPSFPVV